MTRSAPRSRRPHSFRPYAGGSRSRGSSNRAALAVLTMAGALAGFGLAGCGGGGGAAPAGSATTAAAAAANNPSPNAAATSATGSAGNSAIPAAGNNAASGAANSGGNTSGGVGSSAGGSAGNGGAPPARLADFAFYRLGTPAPAGTASLRDGTLALDGRQSADASLVAGACNGGAAFSQCASVASANVFTLCSSDGGGGPNTDRLRSRYVLFDPAAERVTDAAVLRNLSFSGFENCGQDNLGAQPKSAPSASLSFNASGDLTLVRYDQDPARSVSLPSYFVSLEGDTVSGGQAARFNLYRSNGRYLIVATSLPVAGATAGDPGTLIAFMQN